MKKFWLWLARLANKKAGTPVIDVEAVLEATGGPHVFDPHLSPPGAADIRVFLEFDDPEEEQVVLGSVDYISWTASTRLDPTPVDGELVCILFAEDEVAKNQENVKNIVLRTFLDDDCTIVGAEARICNIDFKENSWSCGVDNIVTKIRWGFVATHVEPWTELDVESIPQE